MQTFPSTSGRAEILLARPLLTREEEISLLRKFSGIKNLKDIIGKYGCYLKKCTKDGFLQRDLYRITDKLADERNLKDILAAAVPIRCFLPSPQESQANIIHSNTIVARCLEQRVPLFIISQSNCQVYQVWQENNGNIGYHCPVVNDEGYKCKAGKTKFCCSCCDGYGDSAFAVLLETFRTFTGNAAFPVFELSAFVNYCIFAHYFQDWSLEGIEKKNKETIIEDNFENEAKLYTVDDLNDILTHLKESKRNRGQG